MPQNDNGLKNKSSKFDGRKLSDTICILPFTSLSIHATGHVTSCQMTEDSAGDISSGLSPFDIWQGQKLSNLREMMKRGEFSTNCNNCRKKETKNLKSKRLHWQNLKLVKDLWEKEEVFSKEPPDSIYHIDIAFSNFCNFKCRMCSSSYSSQWVSDEKKLKEMGMRGGSGGLSDKTAIDYNRSMHSLSDEDLKSIVSHSRNVRRIEILGGEPFLTKEFTKFLDLCLEYGVGENTEIMITTNGSTIDKKALEKLHPFHYVNLNVSVDGTGDYFEYMRSSGALSWEQLDSNVRFLVDYSNERNKIDSNKCWKVNLNGAFQAYNMLNLDSFLEWIIKLNDWEMTEPVENSKYRHSFEHRILMGPGHLSVFGAPENLIEESLTQLHQLKEKYPFLMNIAEKSYLTDIEVTLNKALNESVEKKEKLWNLFCWYTQLLDQIRDQNIQCLNPMLYAEYQKNLTQPSYLAKTKEWKQYSLQGSP